MRRAVNSSQRLPAQLEREPPATVKRALVLHWAATNGVSAKMLAHSAPIAALLDGGDAVPVALLHRLQHEFPACTLKQVEQVLETLQGGKKRQSHGTVYTPEYIIDALVNHALGFGWQQRERLPVVCDPACGAAGFLIRAAEILHRRHHFTLPHLVNDTLVGIDVDPAALANARLMLDLYLLSNGVRPDTTHPRLIAADTLLTPVPRLLAQCAAADGFDVVVTNPPYVKLQNLALDYRAALLRAYTGYAQGSFSLALLFVLRCHALLAAQGCAALITQNNLFTSLAGRAVRAYLQRTRSLRRIVDFGHQQVFANASAYTCLLFLGRAPSAEFTYASLASAPVNAATLNDLATVQLRVDDLDARKWRLAAPHHLANLQRIERTGLPLGDFVAIRVGFATLKDAVFVVPDAPGDDTFPVMAGDAVHTIERAITRPAVRVPDVTAGRDVVPRRVIFPYEQRAGRYVLVPEEVMAARYPGAYRYLLAHRDALLDRDKRRKQYAAWYAWGRTQGMDAHGPKLLTKTFSRGPNFVVDATDQLYCNGYGLFPRPHRPPLSLPALARILNSRVMHYYAKLTSFQIEGDYQCYQKNFVERFGVPALTVPEYAHMMTLPDAAFEAWLAARYGIAPAAIEEVVGAEPRDDAGSGDFRRERANAGLEDRASTPEGSGAY